MVIEEAYVGDKNVVTGELQSDSRLILNVRQEQDKVVEHALCSTEIIPATVFTLADHTTTSAPAKISVMFQVSIFARECRHLSPVLRLPSAMTPAVSAISTDSIPVSINKLVCGAVLKERSSHCVKPYRLYPLEAHQAATPASALIDVQYQFPLEGLTKGSRFKRDLVLTWETKVDSTLQTRIIETAQSFAVSEFATGKLTEETEDSDLNRLCFLCPEQDTSQLSVNESPVTATELADSEAEQKVSPKPEKLHCCIPCELGRERSA
ncbi:hypothetical protein T4B_12106 [Trichinella pseudospiralis]|uniref:Uncharacterized protein n=1 Tax=Trichinella pseudospiralis TaxID=6337 RepID=A0A0V1JHB7_TRIPS|nr:hypothetical protein T4A_13938 [Trichinella pseudospiralis]KRZ34358.1 hypothetical protein T4B_12106 [Trichinella pseudospiralis]KRZ45858.1 hypothetical protein T4C_10559 [Trichinella pseudospiralis]